MYLCLFKVVFINISALKFNSHSRVAFESKQYIFLSNGPFPLFFLLLNEFADFGSVGQKRKAKTKMEKSGTRRPSTSAELGNHKTSLQSQHGENRGREDCHCGLTQT